MLYIKIAKQSADLSPFYFLIKTKEALRDMSPSTTNEKMRKKKKRTTDGHLGVRLTQQTHSEKEKKKNR